MPLVEDLLDLVGVPVSQGEAEAGLVVVDIDHLEDEDHVEFATLSANHLQDLFLAAYKRHLADGDGVVFAEHFAVHRLQPFVQAWAVGVILVARLILTSGRGDGRVWISRGLGDVVDDIHAEATGSTFQPEVKNIVHSSADVRVLPIQVRLLGREECQVVFLGLLIPGPGTMRFSQDHGPVVWGLAVSVLVVLGRLPMVPAALGVVFGRARLDEPVMLVGCVVDDEIHHQLHVSLVQSGYQLVDILQCTIAGINVFVIGDIVSHVNLG